MESQPPNPTAPGQRSLAAIVFTDVVSFSARMQDDEEATLRLLKRDFAAMREICNQHHGSVLKTTGDGLLLYFSSAVQAVACALAIQRTFAELARHQPAAETLVHRVGIHLGDVFVNDQDVMGDGVNIAARLQAEAVPGGICISQTVYDVVRNKLALRVTRLGPRELKNISQSIPIYRLLLEAQTQSADAVETVETEPAPEPAVAGPAPPKVRHTAVFAAVAIVLVLGAVIGWRAWTRNQAARQAAAAEQAALNALMTDEEPAGTAVAPNRVSRTLADWRSELRQKRSRALEEYDFGELARSLQDPKSPVAGQPEAKIRAQVLQRTRHLFNWMATHLQRYSRAKPLVVRELTGTAPKELRVFVGSDRRLYYTEGGATRQRNWTDLSPSVLAAITASAIIQADPLPPREVVLGALAFGNLYNLPELPEALKKGRAQRIKR